MNNNRYFSVLPNLLPKDDPRYKKWRLSLKKRPPSWCKGKNKNTDPRIMKIANTFKRKKIDNFYKWREQARKIGLIPSYFSFEKDNRLAFLIGLILGDGHIHKFPRTERLEIALGTDKPKLIKYALKILEEVFKSKFKIYQPIGVKMVKIYLYQKKISRRLQIPTGNRLTQEIIVPKWIVNNRDKLIAFLKGLYEAEASLCIHLPTCTYNFCFHNKNKSLLRFVANSLEGLGLYPEIRSNAIRLRKKNEVKYFSNLIKFRQY